MLRLCMEPPLVCKVEPHARVTSAHRLALSELDGGWKKQFENVYSGGRGPPCPTLLTERDVRR
jgi:hypothetical protein